MSRFKLMVIIGALLGMLLSALIGANILYGTVQDVARELELNRGKIAAVQP